jgi:hypothetical protein
LPPHRNTAGGPSETETNRSPGILLVTALTERIDHECDCGTRADLSGLAPCRSLPRLAHYAAKGQARGNRCQRFATLQLKI